MLLVAALVGALCAGAAMPSAADQTERFEVAVVPVGWAGGPGTTLSVRPGTGIGGSAALVAEGAKIAFGVPLGVSPTVEVRLRSRSLLGRSVRSGRVDVVYVDGTGKRRVGAQTTLRLNANWSPLAVRANAPVGAVLAEFIVRAGSSPVAIDDMTVVGSSIVGAAGSNFVGTPTSTVPGVTPPTVAAPSSTPVAAEVPAGAPRFIVAPNGRADAAGTEADPGSLGAVLSNPGVAPGTYVLLRGGRYLGPVYSKMRGLPGQPIVVRSYPGEWAVLDGAPIWSEDRLAVLDVKSSDVIFRDFEITVSAGGRVGLANPRVKGILSGENGVGNSNNQFLGLVIHDTGIGMLINAASGGSIVRGCVIYNYGEDNEGHAAPSHAIYAQNAGANKPLIVESNVFSNGFGYAMHFYATGDKGVDPLSHLVFRNNVVTGTGVLGRGGVPFHQAAVIAAGDFHASDITIEGNHIAEFLDEAKWWDTGAIVLGYVKGIQDVRVVGNTISSPLGFRIQNGRNLTVTDNIIRTSSARAVFDGPIPGSTWDRNRYTGSAVVRGLDFAAAGFDIASGAGEPGGVVVLRIPDDSARAFVVIWGNQPGVTLLRAGLGVAGDTIEVRNAQDPLGRVLASGPGDVTVSLADLVPAAPLGVPAPPRLPGFAVLVVRGR